MIVDSTPGSITLEEKTGRRLTFFGEWTLEPKFYLTLPKNKSWDAPNDLIRVSQKELRECLDLLLEDAKKSGWEIVVED